MTPFSVVVPIRVVSGDNSREHHFARARRVKAQRAAVSLCWFQALRQSPRQDAGGSLVMQAGLVPLRVCLTRVAPRGLDTDGLASALKPTRDEVARLLGLANDTGPGVAWLYAQMRGAPKTWAVQVSVVERDATCSNCGRPLAVLEPGAWDLEHCADPVCIFGRRRR